MKRTKLLSVIIRIAEIINDTCETDEEIKQVKEGIEKYIDFLESIPGI